MDYLAHIDQESGREQLLIDHLTKTAELASIFAQGFRTEELARRCGLLHDLGKYSEKFQRRIRGSTEQVDHSTFGALEAMRLRDLPSAFCVAGHHAGLSDGGSRSDSKEEPTLLGRMKRRPGVDLEEAPAWKGEVTLPAASIPKWALADYRSAFFFTRMLYSCLVDADYLDTERFMSDGAVERGGGATIDELLQKLEAYISDWWDAKNELNQKRCEILRALIDGAGRKPGAFSLTVPTGGGKTVASVAFALHHAKQNDLKRIIYVIPYVSIIEQTQGVFEDIFGKENVLAHYANVNYSTEEGKTDHHYLAAENWDLPVVVTTAVQFFESLFGCRSSRCRKLHNIAESVIIFDEAQMMPVPYLRPCVWAISQLVEHYRCSAVLCTATQPALNPLFAEFLPGKPVEELCPGAAALHREPCFTRVCYRREGALSDEALAARLSEERQALCIVNNRKQAQALYQSLPKKGSYHLSTTMAPKNRKRVLDEIRERLDSCGDCRVVSTSLVEAGVDLDFPTVYRAVAGLDSLIQAAGRCNRERTRPIEESIVHIFETERRPPKMLEANIAAAWRILREYEDISSPEAVRAYFEFLYYTVKGPEALDLKGILKRIDSGAMPFRDVAEQFRLIETEQFTVYVPYDEKGQELIAQLQPSGKRAGRALWRELGAYAVGVYPWHFKELLASGAVERLSEDAAVLLDLSLYSEETGLSFGVNEGQGFMI